MAFSLRANSQDRLRAASLFDFGFIFGFYDPRLTSSTFIGEQPPDIFFGGLAGAAFGNKTGYKPGRCDIEGKIG